MFPRTYRFGTPNSRDGRTRECCASSRSYATPNSCTVAAAALALLLAPASAAVSVGRIFTDGMVLQDHATYDQRPFIYGSAAAGEVVTVVRQQPDGTNDTFVSPAAADGSWIVQCDPDYFAASQNNLTFYISGSESARTIVIRNAAYGDVFLCSASTQYTHTIASSLLLAPAPGLYCEAVARSDGRTRESC
jgi:hypothetical protein